MVDWDTIFQKISDLFMGSEATQTHGIFGGTDPMLAGVFLFFILFLLTAIWGLGILIGSAVLLPIMFAVFQFIPGLKIFIAIICGFVFGIAIHRLIKR
jgi:hypothetical protein